MKQPAKSSRRPPSREKNSVTRVESNPRPWRAILAGAALALIVLATYAPLLKAEYIWDDDSYVLGNFTLRSPDGLRPAARGRGASCHVAPHSSTALFCRSP